MKSASWGREMFIAGAAAGQARGMPKDPKPWPILCCCGASIADESELRAHECKYLHGLQFIERIAAEFWRSENPGKSVFDCDEETKNFYRERAKKEIAT